MPSQHSKSYPYKCTTKKFNVKCPKINKGTTRQLANIQLQTFKKELPLKSLVLPTRINKCYKLFFTRYRCQNSEDLSTNNIQVPNMCENNKVHDNTEDGHPYIPYAEIPKNYESLVKGDCSNYLWEKFGKKYVYKTKEKSFKSWVNDIYNLYTDVAAPRGKCSDHNITDIYNNRNAHIIHAHDHTSSNIDNMNTENGNSYGIYNVRGKSYGSGNKFKNGNGKFKGYEKGSGSHDEHGKGNRLGEKGRGQQDRYGKGNLNEGDVHDIDNRGKADGKGNDGGKGRHNEDVSDDRLRKGSRYGNEIRLKNDDKTYDSSKDGKGGGKGNLKLKKEDKTYDSSKDGKDGGKGNLKLKNDDKTYDSSKDGKDGGKGNLKLKNDDKTYDSSKDGGKGKNEDEFGSEKKVGNRVTINEQVGRLSRHDSISKKLTDNDQKNANKDKNTDGVSKKVINNDRKKAKIDKNTDGVDSNKNLKNKRKKQQKNENKENMPDDMSNFNFNYKSNKDKTVADRFSSPNFNLRAGGKNSSKNNKKYVPEQWRTKSWQGIRKSPRPTRIPGKSIHALPLLFHFPYDKKKSITHDSQHPDRLRLIRGSKIGKGYLPHYRDIANNPNLMKKYRKSDLFGKRSIFVT